MTRAAPHPPGRRSFLFVMVLTAMLFVSVATVAGTAIALYVFGVHTGPVRFAADRFHLPIASVNGEWIQISIWQQETDAFERAAEKGGASIPGASTRDEIAHVILERLIENVVLSQVAAERSIVVSSVEVDAAYDALFADGGDTSEAKTLLKELGWGKSEVGQWVLRPILLGQHLTERVGSAEEAEKILRDARAKATITIY